jgi:ankyrin repeat protein
MTGQQLCEAARDAYAAKVSTLLCKQGVQSFINYRNEDGATPLHFAAANGHAAVTKQLLAARSNVDLQMANGDTPLHTVARMGKKGHAAVTKQLLAARCNVDLEENAGRTAMQLAEVKGHAGIATLIRNKKQRQAGSGKAISCRGCVG